MDINKQGIPLQHDGEELNPTFYKQIRSRFIAKF